MENANQPDSPSTNETKAEAGGESVQNKDAQNDSVQASDTAQDKNDQASENQKDEEKKVDSKSEPDQTKSEIANKEDHNETQQETKQESNDSKAQNDRDSDYTDVEDDENLDDLKLKIPDENSTENKKLSLEETKNAKKQTSEPTRKGKYYQHDTRNEENENNGQSKNEKRNNHRFDGKEKGERRPNNRRGPNKNFQKNKQNNEIDNKGVAFDDYMKLNETDKFETKKRPNQTKPRGFRRDEAAPTSSTELKNRLDFRTRVPTVLDGLDLEHGNIHLNRNNQVQRGYNRPHGHHADKKFDRPFENNEKVDILITTNFQDSSRQVSLSNHTNRNRHNERRQIQNRQDNFGHYAPQFSGNQRRNNGNHSFDDNLHPYEEYLGYGEFMNANDNSDFSHIRTQTFSNRNFNNYDQTQPRQHKRALTRGNHH